ncbi:MAG: TraR/DksA C4-type zinc finger protein [Nakamurella sp.]
MDQGDGSRDALLHHRKVLLGELTATDAALDRVRAIRSGGQDDDEHDPDGAPLSGEWSRLEGNRRATITRLAEIERALSDLAHGSYGICIDCGATIPPGRLEILPATRQCVDCSARAG